MTTLRKGVVKSISSDKTIKVSLSYITKKYDKRIPRDSILLVHDDKNQAKINDNVLIKAGLPRSKRKTWELVEVIKTNERNNK